MFKVIVSGATFKELAKIDTQNQKLIFELVITLIRIAHRKEV